MLKFLQVIYENFDCDFNTRLFLFLVYINRYHSWAAIVAQLKKSSSEINEFKVLPCT